MNKIFITILFLISFKYSYGAVKLTDANKVVFLSENVTEVPWNEGASATAKFTFFSAVLGHLVIIDRNADIKPSILESFNWDFEKNCYNLRLKENLYFHNGRKAEAKDLEFSLLRPFFAKKANIGTMVMLNLKGTESVFHGQTYQSGLVEGVKILDERTVAVTPSKPNPSFLYTLARSNFSLVPQEEFEKDLMSWKKWPVGVGPYKVKWEDRKNKVFVLSLVNSKENTRAPKEIYFEQTEKYEPDLIVKGRVPINSQNFIKEGMNVPLMVMILDFNFLSKIGQNKDFRKAVNLALSKEKIAKKTIIDTKPLHELITPGSIGRINIIEKQNIEEARKLFKKVLGNDINKTFKVFRTPNSPFLGSEFTLSIKEQLASAGFKFEYHETTDLWNPYSGEFKDALFFLHGKASDYYDPLLSFATYKKGSPFLNSFPNDILLDKLIEDAKSAPSRDVLNASLKNISKYFYENTIVVPLFEVPATAYYNRKKIESIGDQFGGITFYLQNLVINNSKR